MDPKHCTAIFHTSRSCSQLTLSLKNVKRHSPELKTINITRQDVYCFHWQQLGWVCLFTFSNEKVSYKTGPGYMEGCSAIKVHRSIALYRQESTVLVFILKQEGESQLAPSSYDISPWGLIANYNRIANYNWVITDSNMRVYSYENCLLSLPHTSGSQVCAYYSCPQRYRQFFQYTPWYPSTPDQAEMIQDKY